MKERIKLVRTTLKMTMDEFGKKLGVTRSAISNIENGHREPTNQMIVSICREFNVNENWLRYGTGDMIIHRTRNQQIAAFLNDVMEDESTSFRKRLVEALTKLNESDWEVLEKIANSLIEEED